MTGMEIDPFSIAAKYHWIEGNMYFSAKGNLVRYYDDNKSFREYEDKIVVFQLDASESMKK